MSEEPKIDRKTADRDFVRSLSDEQLAAIDGLGIAVASIPYDIRPDIKAMTPEAVMSHLSIGMKLKKARKRNRMAQKAYELSKIACMIGIAVVCVITGHVLLPDWASYFNSLAFTLFGVSTLLVIDAGFEQFNLYELLRIPAYAIAFTGYITLLVCFGSISGAGSFTFGNSGKPAEAVQEQSAGLSQRETDSLVQASKTPLRYSGNDKEKQPSREAERLE